MAKKKRKRTRTIDGLEESDDGAAGADRVAFSVRGPPVATTSGRLGGGGGGGSGGGHPSTVANDEWQTTRRTWEAVAEHFARWRPKRVWMPFYYDGRCADFLRSLGFANVVHTDDDFFERVRDAAFMASVDLIWDNPPYTSPETKERVLRALAATNKPFAMLLPVSVLHVGFVREVVPMQHVQTIVPRRVWVRKTDGDVVPFKYLCWFCCRARLSRDLLFVDDNGDAEEGV